MEKELICIVCPQGCRLKVTEENGNFTVIGNTCKRGECYGITEMTSPTRVITSTVTLKNSHYTRLPVKTNGAVPKGDIFSCMGEINHAIAIAPVKVGDIIVRNLFNTGIDLVATKSMT